MLLGLTAAAQAQNFEAALWAGANFSQIGGDDLAGFNHGGFAGGTRVTYPVNERWQVGGEIYFSHRGSQRNVEEEPPGKGAWDKAALNYIDIPLIVVYQPTDRIVGYGGLGVGILLGGDIFSETVANNVEGEFKSTDFFGQLGLGYKLSNRLEAMLRYQLSVANFSEAESQVITEYGNRLVWITGLFHSVAQVGVVFHLSDQEVTGP